MAKRQKRKKTQNEIGLSKRQKEDLMRFGEQHPVDEVQEFGDSQQLEEHEVYEDFNTKEKKEYESDSEDNSESSEEESDSYALLLNSLGKDKSREKDSDSEADENNDQENFSNFIDNETVDDNEKEQESETEEPALDNNYDPFAVHLDTIVDGEVANIAKQDSVTKETKHFSKLGNLDVSSTKFSGCKLVMLKTDELRIKNSIIENLPKSLLINTKGERSVLSDFQLELLSCFESYKDLLFNERSFENGEDVRFVYTVHALNHILKTRSRIINHNTKLSQKDSGEYRDQGFVRPKVLIVLPFRESCLRVVKILISLMFGDKNDESGGKVNVMNGKRFMEEFTSDEKAAHSGKPDDYKQMFAGNIDDSFRLGISVTKKSLKLYSDFYSSDIIIASPLGLRIIIGAEGDKQRDYDFLSSIEMLIMDQADIFLMQNWEHIVLIMKHLNLQPKEAHGVDFSRVRMWALEGLSKHYRQTLVFSSVNHITINAMFNKEAQNYDGKIVVKNPVSEGADVIRQIVVQCPQIFHWFHCSSIKSAAEERFKYFTTKILPEFKDSLKSHTMIYVASYFDFVKLRNYFRKEELNFTQICEYTKKGKVAQSRSFFFHGGRHFLLYTERAHFFNRYRIKGIRHLIFYELPTYPHFYSELCSLLHPCNQGKKFNADESSLSTVALYNKYDFLSVSAVLGSERAKILMKSKTDTHLFVTENQK